MDYHGLSWILDNLANNLKVEALSILTYAIKNRVFLRSFNTRLRPVARQPGWRRLAGGSEVTVPHDARSTREAVKLEIRWKVL